MGSTEWDEYFESPSWAQQFPFGSESLFTLPVGSDSLYLIARDGFRYGHVTVEQSTEVSDDVIVRIRAAYFKEEAFERAKVCRLERQKNQNGIGIYASFFLEHYIVPYSYSMGHRLRVAVVFLARTTRIYSCLMSH
jgi:hypothetical protein